MESTEEVGGVFSRCRLDPTDLEAVTYFLPRLLSGETMNGAERMIHHIDIYAREPKDLAKAFAPVPQAEQSGDRFFFTTCKRLKGRGNRSARGVGDGKWSINTTKDIKDLKGVKVGEIKNLSFVSNSTRKTTGWVMEEYRCLLPEAIVANGEKVLCKIHLAPNACDAARQESAAYKRRQEAESVSAAHAPKRPAPVAADPPSPKRMRIASPLLQQRCFDYEAFAIPPPSCLLAALTEAGAAVAEADDMDRYTCTIGGLIGGCGVQEELPVESENNNDEYAPSIEEILGWLEEDKQKPPVVDDEQKLQAVDHDMDRYMCTNEELLGGCGVQEELPVESENGNDEYAPSIEEILGWLVEDEQPKQLPPFTTGELKDHFDPHFIELLNDPLEFTCFEPIYST